MTVVFGPDTFTVGADIGLALYPSGSPDYSYNMGSGTNLTVNAANDRVQAPTTSTDLLGRCSDAAAPTGDQEVTASVYCNAAATPDNSAGLAVRVATAGTANGYVVYTNGGNITIYRIDTGSFVTMSPTPVARTFTTGAQSCRFKATGAGATVSLEFQLAATAIISVTDSTASRKTAGTSGFHFFNSTANVAFVDNFQIDDLAVGGAVSPQHTTFILSQAVARAVQV